MILYGKTIAAFVEFIGLVEKTRHMTRPTESFNCPQCHGQGWGIRHGTRPTCCGIRYEDGECRAYCAVPEPTEEQVPCDACGGTGKIE